MALSKQEIRDLYTVEAPGYDRRIERVRELFGSRYLEHLEMAVGALDLAPGETVIDLACGTGLCFEPILERIGLTGRLIGVDLTEAMLERAEERVQKRGWTNVELALSDAAEFPFPEDTHKILSAAGLTLVAEYDQIIADAARVLPPGGRFVVYDFKIPVGWPEWRIQVQMRLRARFGQTRDLEERRPWESMARHFPCHIMQELYGGLAYLSVGSKARDES